MPKNKKIELNPHGNRMLEVEDEETLEPQEDKALELEKHIVFIPSNKIAYQTEVKDGKTVKLLHGSVNGKKYKVLCDSQQEVTPEVFEALKPLLSKLGK